MSIRYHYYLHRLEWVYGYRGKDSRYSRIPSNYKSNDDLLMTFTEERAIKSM